MIWLIIGLIVGFLIGLIAGAVNAEDSDDSWNIKI